MAQRHLAPAIALADLLPPPPDNPELARRLRDLPSCPIPVPRVLLCGGPRRFVCEMGVCAHVWLVFLHT